MVDLSLSCLVTRNLLGLADLNFNASPYRLAGPSIFGGTVTWQRETVDSPATEGDVTIHRRRASVQEPLQIYVSGSNLGDMWTNIRTLIAAFTQDRYTVQINIGSATNQWDCEAADYSVQVNTPSQASLYTTVMFQIPRKPVALTGGY